MEPKDYQAPWLSFHCLDPQMRSNSVALMMIHFKMSLSQPRVPADLPPILAALWHDGKGEWHKAHELAQDVPDPDGAWVHAFLHRKEGDAANAAYWYRRAGQPVCRDSLDQEWASSIESDALLRYFARLLMYRTSCHT